MPVDSTLEEDTSGREEGYREDEGGERAKGKEKDVKGLLLDGTDYAYEYVQVVQVSIDVWIRSEKHVC
jgi:hypothetical protein